RELATKRHKSTNICAFCAFLWLKDFFKVADKFLEVALRDVKRRAFAFQRQIVSTPENDFNVTIRGRLFAADLDGVGYAVDLDHFQLRTQVRDLLDNGGSLFPKIAPVL